MQLFYSFYLEIIEFPQLKKKNRKQIFSAPRNINNFWRKTNFNGGKNNQFLSKYKPLFT